MCLGRMGSGRKDEKDLLMWEWIQHARAVQKVGASSACFLRFGALGIFSPWAWPDLGQWSLSLLSWPLET